MNETTLCYIKRNSSYLLLYRNKKKNDPNEGKWIGVGGGILPGEEPIQGAVREVREETGLNLDPALFVKIGHILFKSPKWGDEIMYLYRVDLSEDVNVSCCDEGTLSWIEEEKMDSLPMWKGDRLFLKYVRNMETFKHMTLIYDEDGRLVDSVIEQ